MLMSLIFLLLVLFFFCRTETALKNQEMELIRNKERLQFFKVQQHTNVLHYMRHLERERVVCMEKLDTFGNVLPSCSC